MRIALLCLLAPLLCLAEEPSLAPPKNQSMWIDRLINSPEPSHCSLEKFTGTRVIDKCVAALGPEDVAGYLSGRKETLFADVSGEKGKHYKNLIPFGFTHPSYLRCRSKQVTDELRKDKLFECGLRDYLRELKKFSSGATSSIPQLIASNIEMYTSYRSKEGFQEARWGMTQKELISAVKGISKSSNNELVAQKIVGGHKAKVIYSLESDRLAQVNIKFTSDSRFPDDAVRKYIELSEVLSSKYGDAVINDSNPDAGLDSALDEAGGVGRSVRGGRRLFAREWGTGESAITMSLKGEDMVISHSLIYVSKAFADVIDSSSRKKLEDSL